ncbi:hypothetical protein OPV22_019921 [Ensete ventricosum]|uniref:Uncharacterized protein n=1 Tax=Ensete ventricosum TaxID=4639 RepID=A0AAV8Q8W5_ENSVE|nr:hypothetical protein OPV22_019921 [Ensete ventricosum]
MGIPLWKIPGDFMEWIMVEVMLPGRKRLFLHLLLTLTKPSLFGLKSGGSIHEFSDSQFVKLWLIFDGLTAWRVVVINVTGHICIVHSWSLGNSSSSHEPVLVSMTLAW